MFTARTMREAAGPILVLSLVALAGAVWSLWGAVIPMLLLCLTIGFFRDPERRAPSDPGAIVAPADGRVVEIESAREEDFLKSEARKIAIFLSVFDVHVQRAPIDGEVRHVRYRRGRHLDARDVRAGGANEHRTVGIESVDGFRIVLRQIAGKVARRIVGWEGLGANLEKGQRLGMIRFGSRVEVFLPLEAEVSVVVGQHVKGGETILARRS